MKQALRAELLAMKEEDVATRSRLAELGELDDNNYHPEMKAVHEKNNKRIKQIINESGWPAASDVGGDGSEAAWLIVQHAVLEPDFQQHCIVLLQQAVENGEAKAWYLAYLQDRVLSSQGKPQIYGTQHGVKDGRVYPLPTENPDQVDARRAALDLWSQQEHTRHLQQDYDNNQANRKKQPD